MSHSDLAHPRSPREWCRRARVNSHLLYVVLLLLPLPAPPPFPPGMGCKPKRRMDAGEMEFGKEMLDEIRNPPGPSLSAKLQSMCDAIYSHPSEERASMQCKLAETFLATSPAMMVMYLESAFPGTWNRVPAARAKALSQSLEHFMECSIQGIAENVIAEVVSRIRNGHEMEFINQSLSTEQIGQWATELRLYLVLVYLLFTEDEEKDGDILNDLKTLWRGATEGVNHVLLMSGMNTLPIAKDRKC